MNHMGKTELANLLLRNYCAADCGEKASRVLEYMIENEFYYALVTDRGVPSAVAEMQSLLDIRANGGSGFAKKSILECSDRNLDASHKTSLPANPSSASLAKYLFIEKSQNESYIFDTSRFRQIEESIIAKSARTTIFPEIAENSYDGIFIISANGLTLYVNEAYKKLSTSTKDSLMGLYVEELAATGRLVDYYTRNVFQTKQPMTVQEKMYNGKRVITSAVPVLSNSGDLKFVIYNVRDVSELVWLENVFVKEQLYDMLGIPSRSMSEDEFILEGIVADSPLTKQVIDLAHKIAGMDSTVLLTGETGAGKDVLAKYIYENSSRRGKPFVKLNCGAIPSQLLESELFGYAPGAFTGAASKGKEGLFERANGGILFLDEIGELPLNVQSTLLRVLQDNEVRRVGATESRTVDVRIIAATNRNLPEMMKKGQFREDLFYRLNVVGINIPPLRKRKEDIPGLTELFISELNKKYKMNKTVSASFLKGLMLMDWPGNVRELSNFIERQFAMNEATVLDTFVNKYTAEPQEAPEAEANIFINGIMNMEDAVEYVESSLIEKALAQSKNSKEAAALLGMSLPTFSRKHAKYREKNGID